MAADLSACPSARSLERLLAEQLTGAERAAVETHVEACTTCQERLESLVAPTVRQAAPVEVGAPAADLQPTEGFLSRLRELSPPCTDGPRIPPPPPATDPPPDIAGRLEDGRLGPYEILAKLGKGGMGTVYKARHTALGKVVALKVLPVERVDEVSIARFKNEIRSMGKLDHPNIVVAFD